MEKLPKFAETNDLIHKGLSNLNKWHGKISDARAEEAVCTFSLSPFVTQVSLLI